MNILPLFFEIDEFCKVVEPLWNKHLVGNNCQRRNRRRRLALAEVMSILVRFHISGYRNFKQFYLEFVCRYWRSDFPQLVGYTRFVEFQREALAAYLQTKRLKKNMKNQLLNFADKVLRRKRAIIESVFDQLKNISQIEHTRHRSFWNFPVNLVAGLIA